ncbi:MAG TPA: DNA gyrase inhibitor YacG [Nitrospiria bacterium]|nr:DNA gyrase inhibitor YacG [Nitrospiria bacterium]HUK56477.1 DNA gyrase inhibitor YacG [Nitrospiria bacterium]
MKLPCPICHKSVEWRSNAFRPFCSERCRMTDLGNWALEKYRIKTENKADEQSDQPAPSDTADAEIHHRQKS